MNENAHSEQHESSALRAFRRRKLSQRRLARDLGISPSYLSEILKGKKVPSLPIADRLSRALGVSMRAFLPRRKS